MKKVILMSVFLLQLEDLLGRQHFKRKKMGHRLKKKKKIGLFSTFISIQILPVGNLKYCTVYKVELQRKIQNMILAVFLLTFLRRQQYCKNICEKAGWKIYLTIVLINTEFSLTTISMTFIDDYLSELGTCNNFCNNLKIVTKLYFGFAEDIFFVLLPVTKALIQCRFTRCRLSEAQLC